MDGEDEGSHINISRFSAALLLGGASIATCLASFLTRSPSVDRDALRWTSAVTVLVGLVALVLPWHKYPRAVTGSVIALAIALLAVSDQFHSFSSEPAAFALYPVFFVMVITWSGLSLGRGASTILATISVPVLAHLLVKSGWREAGAQATAVTLPIAALLGEVVAHANARIRSLIVRESTGRRYDPLTGLANRSQMTTILEQAIARSSRSMDPVSVLFVDLDGFKRVNDSLGHSAGDQLLAEAAGRMVEVVRVNDAVCRFGGDEFVVVLEAATITETDSIARRLIEVVSRPFALAAGEAVVGASVGAVIASGSDETSESLIRKADIAMYRAKANGRGCVELFDSAMQDWVASRHAIEIGLRAALSKGELRLEYQPVVDVDERATVGYEALVRWERDGVAVSGPSEFLPVAEELGLMADIGAWALSEACRQAMEWNVAGTAPRWVAVNVASAQLRRGRLIDQVDVALAESGLDPSQLVLEVTEAVVLDNSLDAGETLAALTERGIRISLDDFGTGYSSLTKMRSVSAHIVKIDGSFVRSLGQDPHQDAIVEAIVLLARNLRMDVIAEGVETDEQIAPLRALGCRYLQGYVFAQPLRPEIMTGHRYLPFGVRTVPIADDEQTSSSGPVPWLERHVKRRPLWG